MSQMSSAVVLLVCVHLWCFLNPNLSKGVLWKEKRYSRRLTQKMPTPLGYTKTFIAISISSGNLFPQTMTAAPGKRPNPRDKNPGDKRKSPSCMPKWFTKTHTELPWSYIWLTTSTWRKENKGWRYKGGVMVRGNKTTGNLPFSSPPWQHYPGELT